MSNLGQKKLILSTLKATVIIAVSILLSACASRESEKVHSKLRNTPAYQPLNVYAYEQLPKGTHRAVMLPILYPYDSSRNIQQTLDSNFRTALNKANVFEVVSVSESEMLRLFSKSHFTSSEQLPYDFFEKMVSNYAADLILFTEVTQYDPYTPIRVGVRSSLVSTRSFKTIWSFDDVFNAGDPRVASGALTYEDANARITYPQHTSRSVLISPIEFSSYVAQTVYNTLPGRQKKLPELKKEENLAVSKHRFPIPSPVAINSHHMDAPSGGSESGAGKTPIVISPPIPPANTADTISPTTANNENTTSAFPPPRPRPVYSN